jgi:hypothetical protein
MTEEDIEEFDEEGEDEEARFPEGVLDTTELPEDEATEEDGDDQNVADLPPVVHAEEGEDEDDDEKEE